SLRSRYELLLVVLLEALHELCDRQAFGVLVRATAAGAVLVRTALLRGSVLALLLRLGRSLLLCRFAGLLGSGLGRLVGAERRLGARCGLGCALLRLSLRGLTLLVVAPARGLGLGGLGATVRRGLRAGGARLGTARGARLRAAGGAGVHDDRDLRGLLGVVPGPLHGGEAAGGEGRGAAVGTRLAVVAKRRGPRGGGSTGGRARLAAACCALLGLLSLRGLRLPSRSGPVTAVRRLLAAPIQLD